MSYNFTCIVGPYFYDAMPIEKMVDRAKRLAAEELAKDLIEKAKCEYDPRTGTVKIKFEVGKEYVSNER